MTLSNMETDVVVVGGGGAGLAAAVSAARSGVKVVLLEKNNQLGGTTGMSIGSITAAGTEEQAAAGIVDSHADHFEDMAKFASWKPGRDNEELRRVLTDNSSDIISWLKEMGVQFLGPMTESPHRVARMHNALPGGKVYIDRLGKEARRLGVAIRTGVEVRRLLIEDGAVAGVTAHAGGGDVMVRARRGVVLAGGDYSGSEELKRAFGGPEVALIPGVNTTATGDCQRMVMAAGGEIVNADLVTGPRLRFAAPRRRRLHQLIPTSPLIMKTARWALKALPPSLIRPFVLGFVTTALGPEANLFADGAMLLNLEGDWCPTEGIGASAAVARQPGQSAFMVFHQTLASRYSAWPHFICTAPGVAYAYLDDFRRSRPDLFHRAGDLGVLAKSLSVPEERVRAAVATFNGFREQSGKPALDAAPFYALGPIGAYVTMTEGGARVTPQMQVVSTKGAPIPGLFAAGAAGQGGLLLEGHGHHLGWAFVSGRIAGRAAALSSR
jgi:succinate dehydrogenase/fumarate reductase flavoprotein subunit